MKTVTSKEFQLHQSYVMKEVANGTVYQVTYHGKPWVELHPGIEGKNSAPVGSPMAFRESLKIHLTSTALPEEPDYKASRKQQLYDKYSQ